ncbi:MAG: hypothetical protein CMF62_00555 [Magnetococcales bacterium]|nr:hypothetical protein [Magnetococcales bacterium]|tara:strand:+ start:2609 stop:4405 length:1797 start_codon:yes stop_codon:yes gene_type:complete
MNSTLLQYSNFPITTIENQLYGKVLSEIKTGNWFIDILLSFLFSLLVSGLFHRISQEKNKLQKLVKVPLEEFLNLSEFVIETKNGTLNNKYHQTLREYIIKNRDEFKLQYVTQKEMINSKEFNKFLFKNIDQWIKIKDIWCILSFGNKESKLINLEQTNLKLKGSIFYSQLTEEKLKEFMKDNLKQKDNFFSVWISNEMMDPLLYHFKNKIIERSYRYLRPGLDLSNFDDLRKYVIEKNEDINDTFEDIYITLGVTNKDNLKGNICISKYEFSLTGYSKTKKSSEILQVLKRFLKEIQMTYNKYSKENYTDTFVYKLRYNKNQIYKIKYDKENEDNEDKDNKNNKKENKINYENRELIFYKAGTCNKKLNNVYLKNAQNLELETELNSFINEKNVYLENGIPHNKGFLLMGPPGTGKTSLVKAISNYLKRNIYMIDLKLIDSNETFIDIVEKINPSHNVIVFEDIDCMGTRAIENIKENKINEEKNFTLSCFLNYLDGAAEYNERVVIMTTNHPEKLDPALIRPGRIDLSLELTNCDRNQFKNIVNKFFDRNIDEMKFEFFEEEILSPAKVITKLISYINKYSQLSDDELLLRIRDLF